MKCYECKHPMFEKFSGYSGHWYCFHKDTLNTKNSGGNSILLCDTSMDDDHDEYEDLRNTEPLKGCPFRDENIAEEIRR